jgi:glucose-1-phosphate cytidylyltransferase
VVRINGGFFAFKREIFDHLREGEDLVLEPFDRLIARRELLAVPFDGFWRNMDTFKDRQDLEELWNQGAPPWTRRSPR